MLAALTSLPSISLGPGVTPVEEMRRLAAVLGTPATLLVKRDDAIPFAFGGNKVRKLRLVAADAVQQGADTLITSGGIQSNHARVTAATAAKLGLRCILVANGAPPERATANALLDRLLGAEIRYVTAREKRAPAMDQAAEEVRRNGGRPYVIPIGASTPLGAAAYALAVAELLQQSRSVQIQPVRLEVGRNSEPAHLADDLGRHEVGVGDGGPFVPHREVAVDSLVGIDDRAYRPVAHRVNGELEIVLESQLGDAIQLVRLDVKHAAVGGVRNGIHLAHAPGLQHVRAASQHTAVEV